MPCAPGDGKCLAAHCGGRVSAMKALLPIALLLCACGDGALEVGAFRVTAQPAGGFTVRARDGRVLLQSHNGAQGYAALAAGVGKARIETAFGAFRFTPAPTAWTSAEPFKFSGRAAPLRFSDGSTGTLTVESPAPSVLELTFTAPAGINRLSLAFACDSDERFLGFGAQADGLEHRGHTIPIWTSEPGIGKTERDTEPELWFLEGARHASSYGLPSFLSGRGAVAVLDSSARSVFELCSVQPEAWRVETWQSSLKLVLYDGPKPEAALERATAGLLGRPPRPPPLAFAPWNDAIRGTAEVEKTAALLRDAGIASSVLWTEDFRGGVATGQTYRIKENWSTDPSLYPDAGGTAAALRSEGFAWFAYFNPFVVAEADVFGPARDAGYLVGGPDGGDALFSGSTFQDTGLVDLSNPAAREWTKGYLRRALDEGFDGWMADFGEWLPHDARLFSKEDPLLAHNLYAAQWAQLNREVLDERAGDGRQRLFFVRAGWLGSTRDSPVVWAGDQRTSFQADDGLPTIVPMGLGLGLGGVSTYGHDIAGYQSATNPPSTKELFFRWTSLGALSPVMRTHHGTQPVLNWSFASDAQTLAHFKRWAQLHIQLFPYLDGASVEAEERGLPLMRAMALAFPDWAPGWSLSDSFLLGPSLLVAPVVVEGATTREVKLPPGTWYALDTGAPLSGTVEVSAPLTELPIFLREGGVVPLLPGRVQTLLPARPPVVDLEAVKLEREVLVAPGIGGFVERGGARWSARAEGPTAPSVKRAEAWVALPRCTQPAQRECFEGAPAGALLRAEGARELACGGSAVRAPEGLTLSAATFLACRPSP